MMVAIFDVLDRESGVQLARVQLRIDDKLDDSLYLKPVIFQYRGVIKMAPVNDWDAFVAGPTS